MSGRLGNLAGTVSFLIGLASCQHNVLEDFDQVETYTRIRLCTKNTQPEETSASRSDSGPVIIDYPFPIHHHHLPSTQSTEFSNRPTGPVVSYPQAPVLDTHQGLMSLYRPENENIPSMFFGGKRKKKKGHRKHMKNLIPMLIALAAKVAHLIPTFKLILLALFSLLLFAKKAFLVSVGSLIIVLYEHFKSRGNGHVGVASVGLWKDRGQAVHGTQHDAPPPYGELGDTKLGNDWWQLEGSNGTKITPREEEKWKRWWAPQLKSPYVPPRSPPQLDEQNSLKEQIKTNLKHIFGRRDYHR